MGFFFAKFEEVADVSSVKSKAGIATEDFEIVVILTERISWTSRIFGPVAADRSMLWLKTAVLSSGPVVPQFIFRNLALERDRRHNLNHLQAWKQQKQRQSQKYQSVSVNGAN